MAFFTCGLLLTTAEARADDGPRFDDKRIHVEGRAGFGTPVGLYGVALELNAFDWLAVGGGMGTNSEGRQWEAHARLRPVVMPQRSGWLHAMTLEGAFARGPYAHWEFDVLPCVHVCQDTEWHPRMMSWGQAEAGLETRAPVGLTWRGGVGLAFPMSSRATLCTTKDWIADTVEVAACDAVPGDYLFVLSVAMGFAF